MSERLGLYVVLIVALVGVVGITVLSVQSHDYSGTDIDADLVGEAMAGSDYAAIGITGRVTDNGTTSGLCSDSDGGSEHTIRGTITGGGVSFSQNDYCLILIQNGQIDSTSCNGTDPNCRLHEFYCQDGVRRGERVQCPYGCSNGACLTAPTTPSCSDSDNGLNYNSYGYVYWNGDVSQKGCIDSCYGTSVSECYCTSSGGATTQSYACPNGCSNGACLAAPAQTCTDSDGGYDRFRYGEVLVTGGPSNLVPTGKDRCYLMNSGPVESCSGNLCTMEEYSCKDYDGDGVKESYGSGVENTPCPNGCSNGACLAAPIACIIPTCVGAYDSGRIGPDSCPIYSCPTTCPQYVPPAPGWCSNGTQVSQGKDVNGCQLPPKCVQCIDSDNTPDISGTYIGASDILAGKYPSVYVKGKGTGIYLSSTTNVIYGAEPDPSYAKTSSYEYSIYYDYCDTINGPNALNEAFCTDGKLGAAGVQCPYGCSNGACLSAPASGSCRTVGNHLEMAMANPLPTFTRVVVGKGQSMNYNTGQTGGNWKIELLGGNDAEFTVLIRVNNATKTMNVGKSYSIAGLIVILDNIEFSASSATATLYVLPEALLNADSMDVASTKKYCYNNNLYQKACPSIVTEDSSFLETKVQSCTYGCINNTCAMAPVIYHCNDTDGDDRFKSGTVRGIDARGEFRRYDECSGNTLTEYYCQGNAYASKTYTCESGPDEDDYACEGSRCIPTYCKDNIYIESRSGGVVQISGKTGLLTFRMIDWHSDVGEIRMQISSSTGNTDSWFVEGDRFVIDGQEFYVENVFIATIGSPSVGINLCYEKGQSQCTDSDGGKNIYVAGEANSADGGTFDGCSFLAGTNILHEAVCGSDGKYTHVTMTCPSNAPYCNKAICSSVPPRCTDSDGGLTASVKGTVTEARLKDGPIYTDYCEDLNTLQPISFNPTANKCYGGSSCGVREFYCNGISLGYRDVACPNGCSDGTCISSNTSRSNLTIYSYEGKCGDGIVGYDEECDGADIRSQGYVSFTLTRSSEDAGQTFVMDGRENTISLMGVNLESKSAMIFLNGQYASVIMSKATVIQGIYLYIQEISVPGDITDAAVTVVVKSRQIEDCADMRFDDYSFDDGDLSCTSDCRYNTSECSSDKPDFCDTNHVYLLEDDVYGLIHDGKNYTFEVQKIAYSGGDNDDTDVVLKLETEGAHYTYTLHEKEQKSVNGLTFFINDLFIDNSGGSNSETVEICFNVQEDTSEKLTVKEYLQPLRIPAEAPNTIFIVGRDSDLDDVIGVSEITAALQKYVSGSILPVGTVKFDDEVDDATLYNSNLVLVGGMCANSATAKMYGYLNGNPENCLSQDTSGVGHIKIMRNRNRAKFVLLVHGYSAMDTMLATRVLSQWADYEHLLENSDSLCVTGNSNAMNVRAC